ncbi:hypothetical protein HJG43_12500 [Kineosporiaceae bacterium SCSIO 59966]|nr:hypothetical protein HJG43_12500 [Kineosporiaceae bacterium SCSIO 59966]
MTEPRRRRLDRRSPTVAGVVRALHARPGEPADPLVRRWPSRTPVVVAVLFFALAQTPSLLPRSWLLQGLVGGITAAIGYGLGAFLEMASRPLRRRLDAGRRPPSDRFAWAVVTGASAVVVVASLWTGRLQQRQTRALVGMAEDQPWYTPLILAVAVLIVVVVVLLARPVRLGARLVRRLVDRVAPAWVASALAGLVAALVVGGIVQGVVVDSFFEVAEESAAANNRTVPDGVAPPDAATRSGGPGSLVPWESLGAKGQAFVAGGPSPVEIGEFAGADPVDPVRVYVGVDSAEELEERVALALAELDRTGAWDRSVLVVATATGTGWVNPEAVDALEYLTGGDSAVVSLQYGYLPSWVSVLLDPSPASHAGQALFDAVHERWSALPAGARPELVVYGESLGSYGAEGAFDDLDELLERTDAVLLVGPTNANPLWNEMLRSREPGSPVWLPEPAQAPQVVVADAPADLPDPTPPADVVVPEVVYLQNSSDPVVWWNPSLLWERPAWLHGERGRDVSPSMRWYPVITFWQVAVDLALAAEVPPGHGHRYEPEIVHAWVALLAPQGWTAADTEALEALVVPPWPPPGE